ncbi:MAG: EAL domain-containing protein [Gammaproteobacteria bacterium]
MDQPLKKTGRLSRQIFLSFLVTALAPALVLSFFAYLTLNDHFETNINRQVYSESRSLGLTLFDRLESMESNLNYLGRIVENEALDHDFEWLNKMFSSLYIFEQGDVKQLLHGDFYTAINLKDDQRAHLQQRALLMLYSSGQQYQFLMITPINMAEERYLVGVVDNDYLWNLTTKETDFFCAGTSPGQLLYCSNEQARHNKARLAELTSRELKTQSDYYEIEFVDRLYVGNDWQLFIQPQFGLRQINIYYFLPRKAAFLEYDFFSNVFPQTMVIILLIAYLLASIQVRRSLDPLTKLIKGANDITEGHYGSQVDIKSNNEFETLGRAFNDMSNRVKEQHNELKTLAKLDRLILSKPDTNYIVEVLLQYIPQVIRLQNLAIMVFDNSSIYMGTVYYHKQGNISLERTNLILGEDEFEELEKTRDVLRKDDQDQHGYLGPLQQFDNQQFLLTPIRSHENLLGVIMIGLPDEMVDISYYKDNVPPLADRAAVALSNANWEKKLFEQAHYDELTGLPNRFLFKDRFEQAMERAKRSDMQTSILFLDLDRFKSVNDLLGHDIGDMLLQEVGNRFLQCVRAYDSVARFGGDEFVIILSDVAPEHIHEQSALMAERIIQSLKAPIVIDEREFFVSPSIGIAIYPQDGRNYDEMLKQADMAMYQAKKESSGSYRFYDNESNVESLLKLELESELQRALINEQFVLNYQPKIDLGSGLVTDVEALIRWHHPKKGIIMPDIFIPLAEESGLIAEIGYWVLREACRQSKSWAEVGVQLNIAINISSEQFREQKFYDNVVHILEDTDVDPHSLEFEITESIYSDNHEKMTRLLNDLKEYGISICMDDFGTGYSSMTYLQQIPVNKLKIDKGFIDKINQDKGSSSIVKAIITLAHSLELKVVAEGVETGEQYAYLGEVSCDEAQGYHICYPLPADELIEFITRNNDRAKSSS